MLDRFSRSSTATRARALRSAFALIAAMLGCGDDAMGDDDSRGSGGANTGTGGSAGDTGGSAGQMGSAAGSGGQMGTGGVGTAAVGVVQCGSNSWIYTAADVEAAATCTTFERLTIEINDGLTELTFPALTSAMFIDIGPSQSALDLRFPTLTDVGVVKVADNPGKMPILLSFPVLRTAINLIFRNQRGLSRADLPVLETVEEISISFVPLEELNLPKLKSARRIDIDLCALTAIKLPALATVSEMYLDCGAIATLELPLLASIGYGMSIDNTALTSLELPALTKTDGAINIGSNPMLGSVALPLLETADVLGLTGNDMLTTVVASSLVTVTNTLRIEENPLLTSLALPTLQTVTRDFVISNNPMLPNCSAESVLNQLTTAPATTMISGNAEGGSCP